MLGVREGWRWILFPEIVKSPVNSPVVLGTTMQELALEDRVLEPCFRQEWAS